MISTLNKIATDHNSSEPHERCEDALWYEETEQHIIGGIFDGCSTGKHSAWASRTLAYAFKKMYSYFGADQFLSTLGVSFAISYVQEVVAILRLNTDNLLSTAILFVYNKKEERLEVRPFGDGILFVVSGDELEVINYDQNNTPDYLGYHVMDKDVKAYLDKYPIRVYHKVTKFAVCSDGIEAVKLSQFKTSVKTKDLLLSTPNSENYLTRMWNILHREGYYLSDDLSIISYAKE